LVTDEIILTIPACDRRTGTESLHQYQALHSCAMATCMHVESQKVCKNKKMWQR